MEFTRVEQIAIEKFKRSSNKLVVSWEFRVIYAEVIERKRGLKGVIIHNLN